VEAFTLSAPPPILPTPASIRVMERLGMTFERRGELNELDTVFYTLTV
jgi:hypothetical protein